MLSIQLPTRFLPHSWFYVQAAVRALALLFANKRERRHRTGYLYCRGRVALEIKMQTPSPARKSLARGPHVRFPSRL